VASLDGTAMDHGVALDLSVAGRINAIHAHFAEFGIVAPVGRNGLQQLLDVVADASGCARG
jgi:hypothetical protein